jgi:hypothetical protein
MIRVREFLQLEPFHEFELLAGGRGLDQSVTSFAVLDYEIDSGDYSAFINGEFVISSLLLMKELADKAAAAVRKLIERGISALAVRVFDNAAVPDEIRVLADEAGIPLFMFRKAYVNDIFIAANNYARARERSEYASRKLDELLGLPSGGSTPAAIVRGLDPLLLPCCTAAFCASAKDDSIGAATLLLMERYSASSPSGRRIFLPYAGGVLLLVSADEPEQTAVSEALAAQSFRDIGYDPAQCDIGIGSTASGYEEYGITVSEAIRASRACRVLEKNLLRFEDAGVYRYALAAAEDRSVARLCAKAAAIIQSYDQANSSELLDTLAEYVCRRGDVRSAARALYQHPNTIRYRLKKAASLLGMTGDVYEQLFMMMNVYLLNR